MLTRAAKFGAPVPKDVLRTVGVNTWFKFISDLGGNGCDELQMFGILVPDDQIALQHGEV